MPCLCLAMNCQRAAQYYMLAFHETQANSRTPCLASLRTHSTCATMSCACYDCRPRSQTHVHCHGHLYCCFVMATSWPMFMLLRSTCSATGDMNNATLRGEQF